MSEERRHHSYSPSTLQMRSACGLWASTGEAGEKAMLGTKQHKFTEDREDDGSLTDEQVMAAQECIDFVETVRWRLVNALHKKDPEHEQQVIEEVTEAYLPLDDRRWTVPAFDPKTGKTSFVKEDCTTGGYVDRALLIPALKHIELFDWKFGRWPVSDAYENLQGIAYVLGAFKMWPWATTVRLHFKQPAIQAISSHTFRRSEIDLLMLKVKAVVERAVQFAREENYERDATMNVPGCLFCGRIGKCRKVHQLAITVGDKFWSAGMPKNMDPISMDRPENISDGLRVAQIVEAWASGYRRQKTLQVLEGAAQVPEGYQIMKYERRVLEKPFRLLRLMRQHLTRREIEKALFKPSLTRLERAYTDKIPRGRKSEQLAILKEEMLRTGAVTMSPPTPYLGAIPKRKTGKDNADSSKDNQGEQT